MIQLETEPAGIKFLSVSLLAGLYKDKIWRTGGGGVEEGPNNNPVNVQADLHRFIHFFGNISQTWRSGLECPSSLPVVFPSFYIIKQIRKKEEEHSYNLNTTCPTGRHALK